MRGKKRPDSDINLGLAVSALTLRHGQRRTYQELADFCCCSKSAIQSIEYKALKKLRLRCNTDPELKELIEDYRSHSHSPVVPSGP